MAGFIAAAGMVEGFISSAMLPSMFVAGVYQGIKNEQNYNSTCKQVDEAEEKLAQTLDKWQTMCANEKQLANDLTKNQQNITLTI